MRSGVLQKVTFAELHSHLPLGLLIPERLPAFAEEPLGQKDNQTFVSRDGDSYDDCGIRGVLPVFAEML